MKEGQRPRVRIGFGKSEMATALLAVSALVGTSLATQGQRLYFEGFESLALGPNVEEALAGAQVWTKTPPAGWTLDDSKMPGVTNSASNGVTEWAGWSFANKNWWVQTAGDQRRSEFNFGQGTVLIADPDEWDDATHSPGLYEGTITTAPIGLTNAAANSLVFVYDSSWRPEAVDDGAPNFPVNEEGTPINNQTGYITASYDNGTPVELQRWTSVSDDPTYHDHMPNESVIIPLNNPAAAKNIVLKFGMEKAANDWWWAVDNLAIGVPPFVSGISANGVGFTVRIVQALGKSVDQAKGVTVELDGTAVTGLQVSQDGDYVLAAYTQTPKIFVPGSSHTVKVKFTSNENKALEETVSFIAPHYTTTTSTPVSVDAIITEPEYFQVNVTKGVQLELDGAAVATASVTRAADTQVVARYTQTQPFASGSSHTLKVTFTTAAGTLVSDSVTFTAPAYATLPTALGTAAGTAAQAGMRWRTHQLEAARGTTVAETEAQLKGTLGASVHDVTNQSADGTFPITVVNFEQDAGEAGNFKASGEGALAVSDELVPGIPGTTSSTDYIAGEALTFIEFTQAGVYTMGVNSDDGFQVSAGTTNSPTQLVLGKFDAGRGTSDTLFSFQIQQPGVYFFRLLWFEGGGGASVEWFTVAADGSKALVGGTQTGALKTYRVRTVAEPTGGGNGGISAFRLTGGQLQLTFTGTLKSADTVAGPYQAVSSATSPFSVTPAGAAKFYIAE